MTSVIRIGARVSAAVGPLPAERLQTGRRQQETWTGLVLASMPEKSWLILWDQSGTTSIHSGQSLKFLELASISESEISTLQARVNVVCPTVTAPSLLPTHDATLAVIPWPLPSAAGTAAQQVRQPVILPAVQNPLPVLPRADEAITTEAVLPLLPQHQQAVLPLVENPQVVLPVDQSGQLSTTAAQVMRNAAEMQ